MNNRFGRSPDAAAGSSPRRQAEKTGRESRAGHRVRAKRFMDHKIHDI
jgi:hypothetical protein